MQSHYIMYNQWGISIHGLHNASCRITACFLFCFVIFSLDKHLYLGYQINAVKNYANSFTQRYKTKLRITCSGYSEWNKILSVLAISTENTQSYYLLFNGPLLVYCKIPRCYSTKEVTPAPSGMVYSLNSQERKG